MKKSLLFALTLASCTHTQYGLTHESDTNCGNLKRVNVRLRAGLSSWPTSLTCMEAVSITANAIERANISLVEEWAIIFTNGNTGVEFNRSMQIIYTLGMTYPSTRVIMIKAMTPYVLAHELGHASDVEANVPNHRDTF